MIRRLMIGLLLAACLLPAQRREYERTLRPSVRGTRGAIATGGEYAAEAGMRLYHRGGNAVDAGVASVFASAVTEFAHVGFGGESPILIRTKDGKVHAIAGVGTMPKSANAGFFRERRLQAFEIQSPPEKMGLKGMVPVAGLMPALTPALPDAALVALREYGVRSASEVLAPSLELAQGFPIVDTLSQGIDRSRRFFEQWPSSKRVFMPEGRVPMPGEIFRQPDLARTIREMMDVEAKSLIGGASRAKAIDAVRDYFYRGEIAKRIDQFSRENGGLLRYEDLAQFRLEPEDAVSVTYRGYQVHKPGFWSQGPTMLEALNILEGYELDGMKLNSADYIHTVTEAMKLAFADRDTYYGDPKFSRVPAERLLSKEYAADRRKQIAGMASLDFRPGKVGEVKRLHPSEAEMTRLKIDDALMARDTTCVDAIDKDGIMFSATPSGSWLPSVIAGDTGIPLTQRAQSFLLVEGHPNELAGGKRPRVTLSPTLVTRGNAPVLALSTPGGDNQEQTLLQLVLNVLEFGMTAQTAIESPRFQTRHLVSSFDNHAMNPGDLLLDERISGSAATNLEDRRHRVGIRSRWQSGAAPVLIKVLPSGIIEAGADPYEARVAHAW